MIESIVVNPCPLRKVVISFFFLLLLPSLPPFSFFLLLSPSSSSFEISGHTGISIVIFVRSFVSSLVREFVRCVELSSLSSRDVVGQPVEAFIETLATSRARGLHVPLASPQRTQTQLLGDLGHGKRLRQILLVGKDEEHGVLELGLAQEGLELVLGVRHAGLIVAVNDKDDALCILVVEAPELANLVLTSDVPYGELEISVFHSFYIESNGGRCLNDFSEFHLVEDCRLTRRIETDHQDSNFLAIAPQASKQPRDAQTHDV